ncbi:hypothetical protein CDD83_9197 [Cordyceps sp. RAO-2017]|nr:hypothetical protein CDD83_9197 [Cordyceps sp. RAO-2017]
MPGSEASPRWDLGNHRNERIMVVLRCGASVLPKRLVAAPLQRPPPVPLRRALSTSRVLHFGASGLRFDAHSAEAAQPRSSPLVGNHEPVAPLRKPPHPAAAQPNPPSRQPPPLPGQSGLDAAASPPPPPPPPRAAATGTEQSWKSTAASTRATYAYTAVKPTTTKKFDILDIVRGEASEFAATIDTQPTAGPRVYTKAVTGRTVFVGSRLGYTSAPTPAAAIVALERLCRDQKVKQKFHSQKFHERRGLKKKRLKSMRWRGRFKTGFKAAVSRVLELKKQGW